MELINITQCPIIEYSKLDEIAEQVKQELSKVDLKQLEISEGNLQFAKNLRAKYNKDFAEFEEGRKLIKKAVNDPYDKFEKAYKDKLAVQFKDADTILKTAIDSIENGLKEEKKEEVKTYFNELVDENLIDFVTFEQVGLNVTLSASIKSLKDQTKSFVERIVSDLALIGTQQYKERIIVRYKSNLNVSQSITSVVNEVKQEELLKEVKPIIVPVIEVAPVEEPKLPFIEKVETKRQVTFLVEGTEEQLDDLSMFMNSNDIKFRKLA